MQLIKFLGEGTYGRIWKVKREGREYALKNFVRQRFNLGVPNLSEMALCMNLDHPHIIKYHEIIHYASNSDYALLMELADCDLYSYIVKNPDLERDKLYQYFFQLCTAVKYLHQAGVAHYDIKVNNCLLVNGQLKLCDFGSSRFFTLCEHDQRPTLCPPEVYGFLNPSLVNSIFKQRSFSASKVDLWSLGETLFFMLTKKHLSSPCPEKNYNFLTEYSKNPREFLSKYSLKEEELELLLLLLQTDADKRPGDVSLILQHRLFSSFVEPSYQPLSFPLVFPCPEVVELLSGLGYKDLHVKATSCLYSLIPEEKNKHLLLAVCLFICSKIYSVPLTEEELKDISSDELTLEEIYRMEEKLFLSLQARCIFTPHNQI